MDRLEADGYTLDASTPEYFAMFISDQYEHWGAFIRFPTEAKATLGDVR